MNNEKQVYVYALMPFALDCCLVHRFFTELHKYSSKLYEIKDQIVTSNNPSKGPVSTRPVSLLL